MDNNQIPGQQDFLYSTVEGAETREGLSSADQMAIYNSPLQFNRFTAPQQNFQQGAHTQLDTYTTNPTNWLQSAYPTNGVPLDLSGLMPGQVYSTEDGHSSISSTSSIGTNGDNNSMYSRHKSANSSHASSPEYSYETKHYNDLSSASTPNSTTSPKRLDADGKVKRSRMGCLTCRHRKKRCCESRPRCHECARLGLKCSWPSPGTEHRNKPKHVRENDGMHYDPFYGNIRILRGIVEHRVGAI